MPKEPAPIVSPSNPCALCSRPTSQAVDGHCSQCWNLRQLLTAYLPLLLADPAVARNVRRLVLKALGDAWFADAAPAPADLPRGFFHFMREAAAACTPGPWRQSEKASDAIVSATADRSQDDRETEHYGGKVVAETMQPSDRRYVALLSPDVGLAIANLVLRAEASSLTLDQARVVRSWAVELECSNARVAELFDGLWGGGTDMGRGDEICAEARRVLAEGW
jgi:hypothetical protein